jgi:hypothetical protein
MKRRSACLLLTLGLLTAAWYTGHLSGQPRPTAEDSEAKQKLLRDLRNARDQAEIIKLRSQVIAGRFVPSALNHEAGIPGVNESEEDGYIQEIRLNQARTKYYLGIISADATPTPKPSPGAPPTQNSKPPAPKKEGVASSEHPPLEDIGATVPPDWKKLGLEQKQLDQMRRVQAVHEPQIMTLEKFLRKLRAEEAADLEKVLTPAQRDKLREIRKGATEEPKK